MTKKSIRERTTQLSFRLCLFESHYMLYHLRLLSLVFLGSIHFDLQRQVALVVQSNFSREEIEAVFSSGNNSIKMPSFICMFFAYLPRKITPVSSFVCLFVIFGM